MPLAVCMPVVHGCWPKLCVRFVVQMAVLIKIPVYRDSMLCAVVCAYWSHCLTGAYHLHVLGRGISVGLFVSLALLVSDIIVVCHIAIKLSAIWTWYYALTFTSCSFSSYWTIIYSITHWQSTPNSCSEQIMAAITGSFSEILDFNFMWMPYFIHKNVISLIVSSK
jgi:hypothetical protein